MTLLLYANQDISILLQHPICFPYPWGQEGFDKLATLYNQTLYLICVAGGTDGLDNFVAVVFFIYLNADGAAFIALFPYEHPYILPMGHPKSKRLSSREEANSRATRKSGNKQIHRI